MQGRHEVQETAGSPDVHLLCVRLTQDQLWTVETRQYSMATTDSSHPLTNSRSHMNSHPITIAPYHNDTVITTDTQHSPLLPSHPHTPPSHPALTSHPHTPPSHPTLTPHPHTLTPHPHTLTPYPHTPPSHPHTLPSHPHLQ